MVVCATGFCHVAGALLLSLLRQLRHNCAGNTAICLRFSFGRARVAQLDMFVLPPGTRLAFESGAVDDRRRPARVALRGVADQYVAHSGWRISDEFTPPYDANCSAVGRLVTRIICRWRLDFTCANANAWHTAGRVRKMQTAEGRRQKNHGGIPSAILACALALLLPSRLAYADGGTLRLSQRCGDFQVSVFTSSAAPCVGPIEVSVLI